MIASNTLESNDPSSVGYALPGVEVRLGEQDELLTRSDSVMLGYWGRPDDTARVLEKDGWLMSLIRPLMRITPFSICARSPVRRDPVFEQVLVLGEQRPYLIAILVLNQQRWTARATQLGLDPQSQSSLQSPIATGWALDRISQLVKSFPSYATPRAVILSLEPWTVANALMTPTLKPKRAAIASRYATEITELYRGH